MAVVGGFFLRFAAVRERGDSGSNVGLIGLFDLEGTGDDIVTSFLSVVFPFLELEPSVVTFFFAIFSMF